MSNIDNAKSQNLSGNQTLSGSDVLRPGHGTAIEVVSGEILLFAETSSGRRLPLASMGPGEILAGTNKSDREVSLLVIGQQNAVVRVTSVEALLEADVHAFDPWIYTIGSAAVNGRWANKVVAPKAEEPLRLAPGESVVTTVNAVPLSDHSILGWLKVTTGTANYCGLTGVDITGSDPVVPMTRGVWLTSGLRCTINQASAPQTTDEWVRVLDFMGRSVLDSINALDEISETARIARLRLAEEGFVNQTLQGIDLLTGAVTGAIAVPHNDYDGQSSAVTAASITVTHAGFILSEENRERADAQIASGRQVFAAVAQACGARVRAIDLGDTWWHQEGPPLVAQTRDDSYVSLLWSGHSWTLTDPAEPLVPREVDEESRARLSGRAWEFLPDLGPKPTNIRSLIQLAFTRSRRDLTVIGVLTAGIAALAFFTPYVFGQLAGSFATTDSTDTRGVITALTALFLLLLVTTAWQYVRSVALLRIRVRGSALTSGAVWDRIMRMRSTWHDKFSLGERMTQSTAVTLSASAVPDVAIVGLLDTAVVLGGLAAIATTNGALLAAVTIFLVIQFAVNFWLTRVGARLTAKRVAALSHTQGRLVETLRAVNRIKVSGAQGRAFRRWSILQADLTRADLALRRITIIQTLVIGAWPVIGLILIVFISGISGATFGDFVTAQTALGIATTTLATTAFSASQLANGRAILSAVKPVLEAVPEGTQDGTDPGRIQGGVSFSEIVFRYSPETAPVLNGVSFTVQPGEHVAVVGPSGCGKTTLMRILLGLEDPESGVIAVDGQDLSVLDRPSFRRQVGSVLQSSTLLPGSIRDNVDMGRGLTMSEIWQALEWACVADDVREMGMGLETPVVDGGGTVSGGQRQRILLARALACNPRMLVLDEATSALDNVTQGSIVDYLENLRLTRIVIAHRLSTIRTADRIIVIAGGRVAQQGTFEELTAQPGHFADLVKRQVV